MSKQEFLGIAQFESKFEQKKAAYSGNPVTFLQGGESWGKKLKNGIFLALEKSYYVTIPLAAIFGTQAIIAGEIGKGLGIYALAGLDYITSPFWKSLREKGSSRTSFAKSNHGSERFNQIPSPALLAATSNKEPVVISKYLRKPNTSTQGYHDLAA